jgi:hypothetical protein
VRKVYFRIQISATAQDSPPGYLFLCPAKDLQVGSSSFRWPDCPASWSLDPEGVQCLSTDEATHLGFPSIQLSMEIEGWYWDASVYTGLRQFHQAKGFDPDGLDVARHLVVPLYQMSTEMDSLFVHGEPPIPHQCF